MSKRVKKIITYSTFAAVAVSVITVAQPTLSSELSKFKARYAQLDHHKKNHVGLLFVAQAKSAQMTPLSEPAGCYRLTLSELNNRVLYFSNEPQRISGKLTLEEFLTTWQHNGKHFTPNVAIEALSTDDRSAKEISEVAMLDDPRYRADQNALQVTACPMGKDPLLAYTKLANVTLFFDHYQPWPP